MTRLNGRYTHVDAALSRATPKARVLCLWNESSSHSSSCRVRLFVLLTVEAFPGAGGLLCGQRDEGKVRFKRRPKNRPHGFATCRHFKKLIFAVTYCQLTDKFSRQR